MISHESVANVACVRGIEIAFPPSSSFTSPTNSKWECEQVTARASHIHHIARSVGQAVQFGEWRAFRARGRFGGHTSSVLGGFVR